MRKVISLCALIYLAAHSSFLAAENHALDKALAAQSPEHQARYDARNPKETLEFFGIQPGMKVAETMPGRGWYSKILLPYLGKDGELVGINNPVEVSAPSSRSTPESLERLAAWPETWPEKAEAWGDENSASVSGYNYYTIPESMNDTLDAILFIRSLHHLTRFDDQVGSISKALGASFRALKPGGIAGVVQHHAREDRDDQWADGKSGYLKKSFVIEIMEAAGFEFVSESDVNANERDQARKGDIVWRLPPALIGPEDQREAMKAIGESNRMTLKFRKPLG